MTHYIQNYSELEGNEKVIAAVRDVHDYLNEKSWNATIEAFQDLGLRLKPILGTLAFVAGIEGYPLKALVETFRPDELLLYEEFIRDCS